MRDYFVCRTRKYGSCAVQIYEDQYGHQPATCEEYCGSEFIQCHNCYFEGSKYCDECKWKGEET